MFAHLLELKSPEQSQVVMLLLKFKREKQRGKSLCLFCKKPVKPIFTRAEFWCESGSENRYFIPVKCNNCRQEEYEEYKLERKRQNAKEFLQRYGSAMYLRFRDKTFKSFEERDGVMKAFDVCFNWLEKPSQDKGIYLYGAVGTGKTHLISAMANDLVSRGYKIFFVSAAFLLDMLRPPHLDIEAKDVLKGCRAANVLFLDDIGAEKDTQFAQEQLFKIVDMRYQLRKPIIYTSNNEVGRLANERMSSRILESCIVLPMKADDYRKKLYQSAKEIFN